MPGFSLRGGESPLLALFSGCGAILWGLFSPFVGVSLPFFTLPLESNDMTCALTSGSGAGRSIFLNIFFVHTVGSCIHRTVLLPWENDQVTALLPELSSSMARSSATNKFFSQGLYSGFYVAFYETRPKPITGLVNNADWGKEVHTTTCSSDYI